jgi:hypothetical protein
VTPKAVAVGQDEIFDRALERLRKNVNNRPKKKKTLLSHLKSGLGKDATELEAINLVESLRVAGYLSIGDNDAVTYHV